MRVVSAWAGLCLASHALAGNPPSIPPASIATASTSSENASSWPTRPVRMIVPFPAGSTPDLIARYVSEKLGNAVGQPVIIDNRVGAGGNIGTGYVARSKADGYTLLFTINGPLVTAPLLYSRLDYDPARDFVPVALIATSPSVLVADARLPVRTVAELRAYAAARPGKLAYGSVGKGSSAHLTMEQFKGRADIDLLHVPYASYAQVVTAMLGGHVQAAFMVPGSAMPQVQAGKLRALAVTAPARSMLLPDLPTMIESGFSQLESTTWQALLAPVNTPAPIIERLQRIIAGLLQEDATRNAFRANYFLPATGGVSLLGDFMRAERERWAVWIRAANLHPEP